MDTITEFQKTSLTSWAEAQSDERLTILQCQLIAAFMYLKPDIDEISTVNALAARRDAVSAEILTRGGISSKHFNCTPWHKDIESWESWTLTDFTQLPPNYGIEAYKSPGLMTTSITDESADDMQSDFAMEDFLDLELMEDSPYETSNTSSNLFLQSDQTLDDTWDAVGAFRFNDHDLSDLAIISSRVEGIPDELLYQSHFTDLPEEDLLEGPNEPFTFDFNDDYKFPLSEVPELFDNERSPTQASEIHLDLENTFEQAQDQPVSGMDYVHSTHHLPAGHSSFNVPHYLEHPPRRLRRVLQTVAGHTGYVDPHIEAIVDKHRGKYLVRYKANPMTGLRPYDEWLARHRQYQIPQAMLTAFHQQSWAETIHRIERNKRRSY